MKHVFFFHEIKAQRTGKKSISAWIIELEEKIEELEDQESDIEVRSKTSFICLLHVFARSIQTKKYFV